MAKHHKKSADYLLFTTIHLTFLITLIKGQCPWQREVPELQSSCLCAYNLGKELSVQCDMVDFSKLIQSLDLYAQNTPIDLLYINNSTITELNDFIFINLKIHNIQLSGCKIKSIATNAFQGQEETLKNLNLQENIIPAIPVESLKILKNLALLDLSKNRITEVPSNAFITLKRLTTLKLSDNNCTISPDALNGVKDTLKNLNLKGTRQKHVPEAIRGLKKLAFLDLSQNSLQELPGDDGYSSFEGLDSLTALNLERNVIQTLGATAFEGVKNTLSSLSLLNNLLADFPTDGMSELKELRVLDIGFNLLTQLPENAFQGNPSITLLALDGNPLSTVPFNALSHLNSTLRGLSLGGRFLHCDCRLRWVTEWIRNGDLQVTSRERNPQFCGSPSRFRERGFYNIQPEELICPGQPTVSPPVSQNSNDLIGVATAVNPEDVIGTNIGVVDSLIPPGSRTTIRPNNTNIASTTNNIISTTSTTTTRKPKTTTTSTTSTTTVTPVSSTTTIVSTTVKNVTQKTEATTYSRSTTLPPWRLNSKPQQQHQRPPLVLGFPPRTKHDDTEVIVKNAFRQDNSVIIQWGSDTANILGFRVVYRLFGDKSFKQGPPLEASEREFKIKNVPSQECIVVCVISLEEINVTPETVPYSQCREVRTVGSSTSNMDKITIAASAAICGTIIIAVIVFIAASRRRSRKMHDLQQQQMGVKTGLPIGGLPVNCCSANSPGGPLSSLATLNAYNTHKEWDQISAYSARSIQRPRIYAIDQPPSLNATMIPDDMRSHGGSHFSQKGNGTKSRSLADGQSQHSFSNHSGRYLAPTSFPSNLVTTRQELRQSRQSLAGASDRMSRSSYPPSHMTAATATVGSNAGGGGGRRTRPRSRTREHRPGSRYSTAGSTHTLNNYCDTSDNWTDHDMDIYMARNPTTRGGLVPL